LFSISLEMRSEFEHGRKKHRKFRKHEQKSKECTLPHENVNNFFNKIVRF